MYVEIHIPTIRIDTIENKKRNEVVEERTPTDLVIRTDVSGNPNFDCYLQPKGDLLYNYFGHSGEFSYGGNEYQRTTGEITVEFDCYPDQLRNAASKRAGEDVSSEAKVLADWKKRAEREYPKLASKLQAAIDQLNHEGSQA